MAGGRHLERQRWSLLSGRALLFGGHHVTGQDGRAGEAWRKPMKSLEKTVVNGKSQPVGLTCWCLFKPMKTHEKTCNPLVFGEPVGVY